MKTVAESCGEKFDGEDLLADDFLKNEIFDYFKTMRLFEVSIRHKPGESAELANCIRYIRQGFYNQLICGA